MALELYRQVRLLPDASLGVLADLAAIVLAEGIDPAEAFELVAFEREARDAGNPAASMPAPTDRLASPPGSEAQPGARRMAETAGTGALVRDLADAPATRAPEASMPAAGKPKIAAPSSRLPSKPAATRACVDCGKVRVAKGPSALARMGPRCIACNGRYNLARRRDDRTGGQGGKAQPAGDEPATPEPHGEPDPIALVPLAREAIAPVAGGFDSCADSTEAPDLGRMESTPTDDDRGIGADRPGEPPIADLADDPGRSEQPPPSRATRPLPVRLPFRPAAQLVANLPQAGDRGERRFTCERVGCGKPFFAEAEKGRTVPYCPECAAELSPPVIREERVVGDGSGGLEAGRVYHRKVLAPAGWREREREPIR